MLIEDVLGRLPEGWQNMPLKELARQTPEPETKRSSTLFPGFEITLFMRAVSIILVVASHLGVLVTLNATSALFLVSGMNFSRFQRPAIWKRRSLAPSFNLVAKFGVPVFLWEIGLLTTHRLWLPNLFLLGTSFQNPTNPRFTFWYLDVLAANIILFGLITCAEAFFARGRREGRAAPLHGFYGDLVLVLAGLGVAALQVKSGVWDGVLGQDSVGPFKWFWMIALGALITQADTRREENFGWRADRGDGGREQRRALGPDGHLSL